MQTVDLEDIKVYPVSNELRFEAALPTVPQKKRHEKLWAPLFLPSQWKKDNPESTMAGFALTETGLKKYSKQISTLRRQLRD